MTIHEVKQGSPEWNRLRRGMPTASNFHRLVTSSGDTSKQRKQYLVELTAERLGLVLNDVSTAAMDYGRAVEPEAVRYYEFTRDVEAREVGFVVSDDGRYGASPDRLVGDDGLLEIKCPQPQTQIAYLLDTHKQGAYPEYRAQVQGQLLVTGRAWCDVVTYSRDLPPIIYRAEADQIFQQKLKIALRLFCDDLEHAEGLIRGMPGFVEAA